MTLKEFLRSPAITLTAHREPLESVRSISLLGGSLRSFYDPPCRDTEDSVGVLVSQIRETQ
jgi:hypothetical protein